MSEYADGFDDGKGEKFDELMVEIVDLREQVEIANKSADDQMFQKRKAEAENAALRKQLKDCSAAFDRLFIGYIADDVCTSFDDDQIDAAKEEGK
jgi:dsDNA-specific endonuclease/ATPase MutS2